MNLLAPYTHIIVGTQDLPYSMLFIGHKNLTDTKNLLHVTLRTPPHSQLFGDIIIPDSARTWRVWRQSGLMMDQRVTTKWRQPLRSSKNAKKTKRHLSILCGRIQFFESA